MFVYLEQALKLSHALEEALSMSTWLPNEINFNSRQGMTRVPPFPTLDHENSRSCMCSSRRDIVFISVACLGLFMYLLNSTLYVFNDVCIVVWAEIVR